MDKANGQLQKNQLFHPYVIRRVCVFHAVMLSINGMYHGKEYTPPTAQLKVKGMAVMG